MENNTQKKLIGLVVSDKMDKTVTVSIESVKEHPIYKKKFSVNKKYKAHDEENQYKAGDMVEITSSKPISRDKKFIVLRKIDK